MRPIALLIAVIHHQPAGEEDEVIARAVDASYRPLLEALWAFPGVRLALRLGGVLPDWLDANDRPFLERLRALVDRKQVELLGGAHWGAPLHTLPERDALAQLQHHQSWLTRRFGAPARAAWLADGAWDGGLPRLLARAGVAMTFLDEGLVAGGTSSASPDGWLVAEREGAAVGVLPVDRQLSALIPWSSPRSLAIALQQRASAGRSLAVAAVSGEQLGIHPHSARWCWARERGWIRRFFEMLRAQDFWLRLELPGGVLNKNRPSGRVAPSTGMPPELGMYALPVDEGRALARRLRVAEEVGAASGTWAVGPPWETALVRYDEANVLHKRALRASLAFFMARRRLKEKLDPMLTPADPALAEAREDLMRVQGAGFYHSGPGGGVLRPEVRHLGWRSVLRAEQTLRGLLGESGRLHHEVADHDCDGQREVLVQTPFFSVVVRPGAGGAISEIGVWELGNLLNTLTRREEIWHDELAFDPALPMLIEDDEAEVPTEEVTDRPTGSSSDTLTSPDAVGDPEATTGSFAAQGNGGGVPRPPLPPLEADLDRQLFVDRYRRAAFQEHFLGVQTTLENLRRGQHPELGDFMDGACQLIDVDDDGEEVHVSVAREGVVLDGDRQHLVRVAKSYRFYRDRPCIDVRWEVGNRLSEPFRSRFAVEINLGLDGAFKARYLEIPGRGMYALDQAFEEEEVTQLHWVLRDRGKRLRLQWPNPATVFLYPVLTPVRTLLGYRSGFQGSCVVLAWDLSLWGGEKLWHELALEIEDNP